MLSETDIELAHPQAFDFVFGNLPSPDAAGFSEHLGGCPHCQGVVAEYGKIGRIIQELPPHVEPPADLEDRAVAAMLRAPAGHPGKTGQPRGRDDLTATQTYQVPPQLHPPDSSPANIQLSPVPQEAAATVTPLPQGRSRRKGPVGLWLAAAAVAILVVVGIILVRPGGGGRAPRPLTVVTPLHATAAAKAFGVGAATGRATARQAGQSWTFQLVVHGLKPLPGNDFYECWWAEPGNSRHRLRLATGGSFVVGKSGSATLTMTTGVDPRQFRTMKITAQSPGSGALHGPVLLTGQKL